MVIVQTYEQFKETNRPFYPEVRPFEIAFTNDIVGLVLRHKGSHLTFELISEEDGNWFPHLGGDHHIHWLPYYVELLVEAQKWVQHHCLVLEVRTMTTGNITTILTQHAEWLQDCTKGKRADLSGAKLRDTNLRDTNLRNANLHSTNLSGASLLCAKLSGADLRGANLRGANLRSANLSGADLRGADLHGAYLNDADLSGANLDHSAWPLWCGSLRVTLDERQQAQLLYHVLAVSPVARKLASVELLEFANSSHVVTRHGCTPY